MRGSSCLYAASALAAMILAGPAAAEVKIVLIDPLSGGAASAGIMAQKHITYLADRLNAAGGLNGEKVAFIAYDNKVDPQESLIALKKALDDGARYVFQGNGSSVALAITDAVLKYNERNPGKEVLYFNYAAVDPDPDQRQVQFLAFPLRRRRRHEDVGADRRHRQAAADQERLPDQPGLLVRQGGRRGGQRRCSRAKRPDIKIVGDELHPLQKVQDFSPYVAKIKAAGADTVITGNWSNDMLLLIKAGKDAGLKVNWYTYYGGALGSPSAYQQGRRSAPSSRSANITTMRCPSSIPTLPRTRSASPARTTSSATIG